MSRARKKSASSLTTYNGHKEPVPTGMTFAEVEAWCKLKKVQDEKDSLGTDRRS